MWSRDAKRRKMQKLFVFFHSRKGSYKGPQKFNKSVTSDFWMDLTCRFGKTSRNAKCLKMQKISNFSLPEAERKGRRVSKVRKKFQTDLINRSHMSIWQNLENVERCKMSRNTKIFRFFSFPKEVI